MNNYGVVIKTNSNQHYAYITATNQIVSIDNDWYASLPDLEKDYIVFETLSKNGFTVGSLPKKIDWQDNIETYLEKIKTSLPSLVLEITQECNLRCDYCIYSGNYENVRTHNPTHMDFEMIKRCVDFYAEHSTALNTAHISFYGGEALIHFELIKEAVEYAEEVFCDKELSFGISTNGTTLSEPVLKWLNEHTNISLAITHNGLAHDKYRKFPSGKGSLSVIESALNRIKLEYPEVWKRTNFIANITSLNELLGIREYYSKIINKPPVLISGIIKEGGNEIIHDIVDSKDSIDSINETNRLFYYEQDEYITPCFQSEVADVATRKIGVVGENMIITSSCMPFYDKFFISANGYFGICEKAGENSSLGDIYNGFNIPYIIRLVNNVLILYNNKCRNCWCQRLCKMCIKDITVSINEEVSLRDGFCEKMRKSIAESIKMFCQLAEINPDAVNHLIKSKL